MTKCDDCGKDYGVGQWYDCPHEFVISRKGFVPYYDENISADGNPAWIQTPGDKKKYLRPQWRGDYIERIVEREPKPRKR